MSIREIINILFEKFLGSDASWEWKLRVRHLENFPKQNFEQKKKILYSNWSQQEIIKIDKTNHKKTGYYRALVKKRSFHLFKTKNWLLAKHDKLNNFYKIFLLTVNIMHIILRPTTRKFFLAQYLSQSCKKKIGDKQKEQRFHPRCKRPLSLWEEVTYAIRQNHSFLPAFYSLLPPPSKRENNSQL